MTFYEKKGFEKIHNILTNVRKHCKDEFISKIARVPETAIFFIEVEKLFFKKIFWKIFEKIFEKIFADNKCLKNIWKNIFETFIVRGQKSAGMENDNKK